MVFISGTFLLFFAVFFALYWFVVANNLRLQNLLILVASYVFYAWSDWRFLGLLIGASLFNFYLGIWLEKQTKYHKWLLLAGLIQGVGSLLFFKYCNFFIDSFVSVFNALGLKHDAVTLDIIIPLGISFYTFRTLSYILDIDKGKIDATKDWVVFFSYVAFFPCLLSGPIDKAGMLIPQLQKKRQFDYAQASDGMRQILWGMFKKMVIADNCATITSQIFHNYQSLPASTLFFGALLYTIQIYTDFSGYSDMALGVAHLLGINITRNFAYPLFAKNIAEFWRTWHISLTSWLTEYVFTPLSIAFRDLGKGGTILAILINFTLIGIWHGPSWCYVLFGFLNGCYFIPLILNGTMNKRTKTVKGRIWPSPKEAASMIGTYLLVSLTLVLFISPTLSQAAHIYSRMFSHSLFSLPLIPGGGLPALVTLGFAAAMLCAEWLQREKTHALQIDGVKKPALRLAIYYSVLIVILFFSAAASNQFIYFKF